MKKILYGELLTNILWSFFGFIGFYQFYNQKDYLPAILLLLIGLLYVYRLLFKDVKNKNK